MKIGGLTKTTLLDYPGHVAAAIFTRGCNFRCPYCHNSELLSDNASQEETSEEKVLAFLKKRANILEGVCITGGEPTLQHDLPEFIAKIKALGYLVKLDTNGTNPAMLQRLIDERLIDRAAMDIKNAPEKYAETTGLSASAFNGLADKIRESVEILLTGKIPYEFRTTVVKGLHTEADMEKIGRRISGAEHYYLQSYKESENVLQRELCGTFHKEELLALARAVKYVQPELRGID